MNLLVALLNLVVIGAGIGYWLGRFRPILRARDWARDYVVFGGPARRTTQVAVIALLPGTFTRVLWHRLRYGAYPQPRPRRVAKVPALIVRRHTGDNAEDCPACSGTNLPWPFICPGPTKPRRPTEQQGGIPNDAITRADQVAARKPKETP